MSVIVPSKVTIQNTRVTVLSILREQRRVCDCPLMNAFRIE